MAAAVMAAAAVLLAALAGWCFTAGAPVHLRRIRSQHATEPPVVDDKPVGHGRRRVTVPTTWRAARRRRTETVELCQALSAELRGGAAPRPALAAAANGLSEFDLLKRVAETTYGDVVAVLCHDARLPGGGGLARLVACWRVCERSGVGLAAAVERLADALRDDEQVRRETAAQLAAPRATAVLLALLPVFGLAIGAAVGARPLAFLLHTRFGLMLLLTAGVLEVLGLAWTARITRTAVPP